MDILILQQWVSHKVDGRLLFLKNDSYIYCTTIKVETPYSGKRKCPPENQTDIFIKSSYDPSDEHRKEQQKLTHAEQDEIHNYEEYLW